MAIQGLLVDVDGTLLDSNDAHARAWVRTFADFGYDIAFSAVRPLIGMGGDKLLATLVPGLTDEVGLGKTMSARRTERFLRDELGQVRATPGARALLVRLGEAAVRLVIATSAKEDELHALLQAAGVDDLLTEWTTADDAEQSKPDPDVVVAGLHKLHLPPSEVLMLGDTPYDVEAATRAGVATIALRCGGWSDVQLENAAAIYDDPRDLLAQFADSPLGHDG